MVSSDVDIEAKELSIHSSNGSPAPFEDGVMNRDEERLAHFGKKQRFRRDFGLVSIVGLSCTLMLTWEGVIVTVQYTIFNGGPTGAICQYIFVVFGVMLQTLVMAEMASMIPLSGGQYNWVAILSPPSASKFLSYITGWLSTIAWQAACASAAWLNAGIIQATVTINHPGLHFKPWQGVLIFYAVIALSLLMNTYFGRIFPKFEALALFLHIVGFFAILIILVYLAPKASAHEVFHSFNNGGHFSTYGQSFMQGSVTYMLAFLANDAGAHLAEEVQNAPVTLPRSMISSVTINSSLGFAMLIVMLFCAGDPKTFLNNGMNFPFVSLFQRITGSAAGATGMVVVMLVVTLSGSIGLLAATSRMLWAFAREEGVPGSSFISHINDRTSLPIWSICVTTAISLSLALLNLGSHATFQALTGLTVSSFYTVFIISASIMLHKRLTTPADQIFWGDFKLGRAGVPITIAAIAFSIIGWFFCFWPPFAEVNVRTFNWSSVVYFGVMMLSMVWWFVRARHVYTGPKIEVERK